MKIRQRIMVFGICLMQSAAAQTAELSVHVSGFATDQGQARIIVMRDEAGYRGEQDPELIASAPIVDRTATWRADLTPGAYALLVHHDIDRDDQFDRPIFDLPFEAYGFSNGAWTSFGIPYWRQAAFQVSTEPVHQVIKLRMNAFAVFANTAAIGVPFILLILAALAVIAIRRHRSGQTNLTSTKGENP